MDNNTTETNEFDVTIVITKAIATVLVAIIAGVVLCNLIHKDSDAQSEVIKAKALHAVARELESN